MRNDKKQRVISFAALGLCLAGCDHAPTTGPEPPAGGQAYVLSYDTFSTTIEPILSGQGCDNLNCHGGGIRGTFQLSPPSAKDVHFDFSQACMQVTPWAPRNSPLAMKPLAEECGGATHGGGAFFFALDDPNYVAILQWVESGHFE